MAAAWGSSLPPIDRLVLLALADWADKGGRCWPSIPQLATKTGVHERTVRLAIARLESGGHLERQSIIGKGTRYRLNAEAEPTPGATPPPGVTPTPGVGPAPGAAPGTPGVTPTNTPAIPQERKKTSSSPFTRTPALNAYPMPDGVDPQAWADFLAARKRKRLPNTASAHKTLMDDLARHATDDWPIPRLVAFAAGKGWASVRNPEGIHDGRRIDRARPDAVAGPRRGYAADMLTAALARPDDGSEGDPHDNGRAQDTIPAWLRR